jgi:hypothetical protein
LATYERWEAKYDRAEDALNDQCLLALARLMGGFSQEISIQNSSAACALPITGNAER